MSKQTYRVCFCFRRKFRLAVSEAPEEIKKVFEQYSENGIMSIDGLQRFLVEVQKEDKATREDAQKIIDSVKHFHRKGLNREAFVKYLFGDINPPLASPGVINFLSLFLFFFFPFSTLLLGLPFLIFSYLIGIERFSSKLDRKSVV